MFRATPTCQGSLGGSILARLVASLAIGSVLLPTVCTEGRMRAFLGRDGLGSARTAQAAKMRDQLLVTEYTVWSRIPNRFVLLF